MKRLTLAIAMAALVLFAGCKKDKETTGTTIKASIEQCKGDGSKTTIVPDGAEAEIRWTAGDKILVNNGTTSGIFTLVGAGGSTSGTFSYNGEYTFGDNNVAVYPAENTTISGNTVTVTMPDVVEFDANKNGANPMLGKITNPNSFSMKSLCGVLGISLKAASGTVDIKAVEVVSNSSTEKLNGTFTVDANATEDDLKLVKSGDDGTNSVRLNCNAQLNTTEAQSFYFALPVGALSTLGGGFTLNVYGDGTDPIFTKTSSNAPIALNKVNQMPTLEVTATSFNPYTTPLTFEAKEAGATVKLSLPSQAGATMEYSTDGTNWSSYTANTAITLANTGDKVMFRAPVSGNTRLGCLQSGYFPGEYVVKGSQFSISDHDCYVYGNVMSLLYQDFSDKTSFPTGSQYTMPSLFSGCDKLYNHPDKAIVLPATTLAVSCYESMFNNCENLTTIPELPATTLAESCYKGMFNHCSGLTTIPDDLLPATTLVNNCYQNMFTSCTGLTSIPENLLQSVTTLANYCYASMFSSCSGLTSVPDDLLPVTTLAPYCYQYMFTNCTGLTTVPADLLPATTLASNCYKYMFDGCTNLTTAPDLPAAELVSSCYYCMFQKCSNLHSIKCLATSGININSSTSSWVYNVSTTGTFYADLDATWSTGQNGIPTGWNVVTIPEGALKGKFTINANGDQVYFSKGNLQYIGSAATPYWKFADHQWEYLGNNGQNSTSQTVDRDLFSWGTSGYNHNNLSYQPWDMFNNPVGNYYAYGNVDKNLYDAKADGSMQGMADWGYNPISNGGNTENSWRTIKRPELAYILVYRPSTVSPSGIFYAKAVVNGINGIILLPDDWDATYYTLSNTNSKTSNFSSNTISESDWLNQLEPHGAVFFPAYGYLKTADTNPPQWVYLNEYVCYYLSSRSKIIYSDAWAVDFFFVQNGNQTQNFIRDGERRNGMPVRLIKDVQ